MNRKFLIPLVGAALLISACGGSKTSKTTTSEQLSSSLVSSSASSISSNSSNNPSSTSNSESSLNSSSRPNSSSNASSSANSVSSSIPGVSSSTSSAEQKINVSIINKSTDVCTLVDVTTRGFIGDDASFTIQMKEGFEFISVKATSSDNRILMLIKDDVMTYSTPIPNDGVINITVTAKAPEVFKKLYIQDNKGLLVATPQYKDGKLFKNLERVTDDGDPYYKIPDEGNHEVRFKLDFPKKFTELGMTFNGDTFYPDEYGYVTIDFTGETGTLLVKTFGTRIMQNLTAVNSSHLTIDFYSDPSFTTKITQAGIEETIYLKISSTSIEDFVLDKCYVSGQYNNSTSTFNWEIGKNAVLKGDYYIITYQMEPTQLNSQGATFTVSEDDLTKFKTQPFIGSYLTFKTFTYSNCDFTTFTFNDLTILGSGKADTSNGATMKITNVQTDSDGVMYLRDRAENAIDYMIYKNDVILYSTISRADGNGGNSAFYITSPNHASYNTLPDDIIGFKMLPESYASEYSLKAQNFTIDGVCYTVATVYYQNNLYKTFYMERVIGRSSQVYVFDATVEFLYGNYVTDKQSVFAVKQGTNTINIFGFKGDGGYNNRNLCDSKGGLYTGENHTLVLCNTIAVFDGQLYTVKLDGNVLTLETVLNKYVLQLDFTNKTFTVITAVENTAVLGPFAGKKYRFQFNANPSIRHNGEDYGCYIEFDQNEPVLSMMVNIQWNMTMSTSSGILCKTNRSPYLYNAETNTFKAMITGVANEVYLIEFRFVNNTIKFQAGDLDGEATSIRDAEVTLLEVSA